MIGSGRGGRGRAGCSCSRAWACRGLPALLFLFALIGAGRALAADPLGVCADHRDEDHRGHDHYGADLYDPAEPNCSSGLDLTGARFDDADLRTSDLETMTACLAPGPNGCGSFLRTRFDAANLERADLAGARLSAAVLDGVVLDAAGFEAADLESADLSNVSAVGGGFECAGLAFARLDAGVFTNARFTGADLASAYLVGASFDGADFGDDATACSGVAADLRGADLSGADLLHALRLERALVDARTTYDAQTLFSASFRNSGKLDQITLVPEPGPALAGLVAVWALTCLRRAARPRARRIALRARLR